MSVDNRKITIYQDNIQAIISEQNVDVEQIQNNVQVYLNEQIATEVNVGNVVMVETDAVSKEYFRAGTAIAGHKVVFLQNGLIYPADCTNPNCFNRVLGFILRSVSTNENIVVKKTGTIYLEGWGLIPNKMYYLQADGLISYLTKPKDVIRQSVGVAISANELALDFSISVKLN